ncbi:MAG: hypothetical protein J6A01_04735 [Proteobacteria bacterium]|nr:hypothetical protein [Pseudomonadota bacterium]
MRIQLSALIFLALAAMSPALASAHPDSHEIIQKIALEELANSNAKLPVAFKLPKTWKSHPQNENILNFWVPYHNGVMGHIEKRDTPMSWSDSLSFLSDYYKTKFKQDSNETFQLESGIQGQKGTISGPIGGEEYRLFVCVAKLPDNTVILYYASAPILWFQAYAPLFNDILNSFQMPAN